MLPVIEDVYHDIEVNGNKLKVKAWKTKDEKNYLIAKESGDFDEDAIFDVLIKPCIKEAEKYNFTDNEKLYIMTKIREFSLGTDIEIAFTCPVCSSYQDIELDLSEIVQYKKESYKDVKINDYLFKFKKSNSSKIKERTKGKSSVEKDFINMVSSIYEIKINEELYDAFTFDELYEFIENLDTITFNELYSEYFNMVDSISFEYETECLICKAKIKDTLSSIPNFLWD